MVGQAIYSSKARRGEGGQGVMDLLWPQIARIVISCFLLWLQLTMLVIPVAMATV